MSDQVVVDRDGCELRIGDRVDVAESDLSRGLDRSGRIVGFVFDRDGAHEARVQRDGFPSPEGDWWALLCRDLRKVWPHGTAPEDEQAVRDRDGAELHEGDLVALVRPTDGARLTRGYVYGLHGAATGTTRVRIMGSGIVVEPPREQIELIKTVKEGACERSGKSKSS